MSVGERFFKKIYYFRSVLQTRIITTSNEMPALTNRKFFQSAELFELCEQASGQQPLMVVAERNGAPVAHLLAVVRRRGSLVPPYLFTQCRVYGVGEYDNDDEREELFPPMLAALTAAVRRKGCLNIEFSELPQKMFAYKHFRSEGYFPVHWMEVHNSLHSTPPIDRLEDKTLAKIRSAERNGVTFKEVESEDEFHTFYKLVSRFPSLKVRRYLPPRRQFLEMWRRRSCRFFVSQWKGKVVGGCTCAYSEDNAYLWFLGAKRKSHPRLHPATFTVWGTISDAYARGCRHIYFMDVGLPFKKSAYREFILSFGGKEVSTYRWFRFSFAPLNRLLSWIYKE